MSQGATFDWQTQKLAKQDTIWDLLQCNTAVITIVSSLVLFYNVQTRFFFLKKAINKQMRLNSEHQTRTAHKNGGHSKYSCLDHSKTIIYTFAKL